MDVLVKIGHVLSDMNVKSMAETWKAFISFYQKASDTSLYDLTQSFQIINMAIKALITNIAKEIDAHKGLQSIKVVGFLVKVTVKLFELQSKIAYYDEILAFCFITMGGYGDLKKSSNQTRNYKMHIMTEVNAFISDIFTNSNFITKFLELKISDELVIRNSWTVLIMANNLLTSIPDFQNPKYEVLQLIKLILECTSLCYADFFLDDMDLYKNISINVSILILTYPSCYKDIVKILLKHLILNQTWTALLVADIWWLILKHSTRSSQVATFRILSRKIGELDVGIFESNAGLVFLNMLLQRIANILPQSELDKELSRYKSLDLVSACNFLFLRNLSNAVDLDERCNVLCAKISALKTEDLSPDSVILPLHLLDAMCHTHWAETSRIFSLLRDLWAEPDFQFFYNNPLVRFFTARILIISSNFGGKLADGTIMNILTHLHKFFGKPLFKIIGLSVLAAFSDVNMSGLAQKRTFSRKVKELLQMLMKDSNGIIAQLSSEIFNSFSENYPIMFLATEQKKERPAQYNFQSLEDDFRAVLHRPDESEGRSSKRVKTAINIDDVISNLQSNCRQLQEATGNCELNRHQIEEIRNCAIKLDRILKQ